MIGFALFVGGVLALLWLGLLRSGSKPLARRAKVMRLRVVRRTAGRLRVRRGALDRKDVYYDPRPFRRPR
ncbi:hypothetical protein [Acidihalobacter ferrooxydans]|uniref:Uncharacterized protein n=1 Tax=Acidihalobacter ferrooxydans TaxID=1765967 RepID=A0A1P8UKC3_9GAMM|nr:hypothetical protein [Acidihalobacter ferrooxydans]APZ44296.1 hypothetical protein BW247_15340 [Acidihalobacter ferrooxydans]